MKSYSTIEISRMVGVNRGTIRQWYKFHLIPSPRREGRLNRQVWWASQVHEILLFAESLGYFPRYSALVDYKKDTKEG